MADPLRVLIVDDSRIFRAAIADALQGESDISVVGSVYNGEKALEFLDIAPVDIVTLDVEMPGLNGLDTLAEIQRRNAARRDEIGVLMVSSHTKQGAEKTIEALRLGAFDFITKPDQRDPQTNRILLKNLLLTKLRGFGMRRASLSGRIRTVEPNRPRRDPTLSTSPTAATAVASSVPTESPLRRSVQAVVIGVSTGGPKALEALLPELSAKIDPPILIVQHMPAQFTTSLAEHLCRSAGLPIHEAKDGEPLEAKAIYLAPGGRHLVIRRDVAGKLRVGLNDLPPENGFRPAADVLFRSAAAILGAESIGILLTGMGTDGTEGFRVLKRAGAYTIAQDEASSTVWGMPGKAVEAGVVDRILPLNRIAAGVFAVVGPRM